MTFRILTRLRVWFYTAVEPLAPARLQGYHSGDLLTRIVSDIETLDQFYVRVVIPPLAAALVTGLSFVILGAFDLDFGLGTAWLFAADGGGAAAVDTGIEQTRSHADDCQPLSAQHSHHR